MIRTDDNHQTITISYEANGVPVTIHRDVWLTFTDPAKLEKDLEEARRALDIYQNLVDNKDFTIRAQSAELKAVKKERDELRADIERQQKQINEMVDTYKMQVEDLKLRQTAERTVLDGQILSLQATINNLVSIMNEIRKLATL